MKRLHYIFIFFVLSTSCSEYQRVLKSEDISEKFKLGTSLFESGKFRKANTIFKQIVPSYRGKPQAEKLMYMYCMTFYENRQYITSNNQMEMFELSYPKSEKVEEIAFLAAKSYYNLSPIYSKDQPETYLAIEKFQNFINKYPESSYLDAANGLVAQLQYKLEKKAYNIALQYNRTGPFHRDYNSAIKAFDNFLFEFPGSSFKEDALFYKFDSAYKLAINSVKRKQKARTDTALSYYKSLIRAFPESKYSNQLVPMHEALVNLQNNFTITKS